MTTSEIDMTGLTERSVLDSRRTYFMEVTEEKSAESWTEAGTDESLVSADIAALQAPQSLDMLMPLRRRLSRLGEATRVEASRSDLVKERSTLRAMALSAWERGDWQACVSHCETSLKLQRKAPTPRHDKRVPESNLQPEMLTDLFLQAKAGARCSPPHPLTADAVRCLRILVDNSLFAQ